MDEIAGDVWTIARIRAVTLRVAAALVAADAADADRLSDAAGAVAGDAEALLLMRSALIATRATWEALPAGSLVDEAKRAVAAGKRLSIDLEP